MRIRFERRHSDVALLSTRQIRTRSFPHWFMAASVRTPAMQAMFERHGLERIEPAALTAPSVLALAMNLQDFERTETATRRAG